MKRASIDRRKLALAAFILSPLIIHVVIALASRAWLGKFTGFEWSILSMGLYSSLMIAVGVRSPLIDPHCRWGILGRRERSPFRLWMFLLGIVAICPLFAFVARQFHEMQASEIAFDRESRDFEDRQISRWIEVERQDLAKAHKFQQRAAACREKEARGGASERWGDWAEIALDYEESAAFYRSMAAQARAFVSQHTEARKRLER